MSLSPSRLIRSPRRRALSALLGLVYLWAFAGLGLTHRHAAPTGATRRLASVPPKAPGRQGACVSLAVPAASDTFCHLCATARATIAALAQSPVSPRRPLLELPLNTAAASSLSLRSILTSSPRAPPYG